MTTSLLEKAAHYCEDNKYRFTAPRKYVLDIIATSSKSLGAYEILDQLGKMIDNPKPPTVYRAIDFWQKHGFIHRIESLNAYKACEAGHRHKGSHFMICDDCGEVIETHLCDLPQSLKDSLAQQAFKPSRWSFEIHGVCSLCI
jgi:Fur family zinc uptake transcriptional regulator